jgi:hypothetical protein
LIPCALKYGHHALIMAFSRWLTKMPLEVFSD